MSLHIKIGEKTKALLTLVLPLLEAEVTPEAASIIKIVLQGKISHAQVLAALKALSEPTAAA